MDQQQHIDDDQVFKFEQLVREAVKARVQYAMCDPADHARRFELLQQHQELFERVSRGYRSLMLQTPGTVESISVHAPVVSEQFPWPTFDGSLRKDGVQNIDKQFAAIETQWPEVNLDHSPPEWFREALASAGLLPSQRITDAIKRAGDLNMSSLDDRRPSDYIVKPEIEPLPDLPIGKMPERSQGSEGIGDLYATGVEAYNMRREPRSFDTAPLYDRDNQLIDWGGALVKLEKAIRNLDESMPGGQKQRTIAAVHLLREGFIELTEYLALRDIIHAGW